MAAMHDNETLRGQHAGPQPLVWRLDGPASNPKLPLVIALHGWGMDEDRFARRLGPLPRAGLRVLVPRAPLPLIEGEGWSWYDYDGDQDRFRRELLRTEALLVDLVHGVERNCDLTPRRRWILGFSQGGYCGSWLALRQTPLFDGMVVIGARVKTEWLADEMHRAAASGFQALLCHGRRDRTVSFAAAESSRVALEAAGVAVDLLTFHSGHTLGKGHAEAIARWLATRSGNAQEPGSSIR